MAAAIFKGVFLYTGKEDKIMNIILQDGSKREFEKNISVIDAAKSISEGLAKNA